MTTGIYEAFGVSSPSGARERVAEAPSGSFNSLRCQRVYDSFATFLALFHSGSGSLAPASDDIVPKYYY